MRSREKSERHENEALRSAFRELGLDPLEVWVPPDDLCVANRQLRHLLRWACAYRQCPDRKQLVLDGFEYPPVEPDLGPENDWFLFERWMRGEPLRWTLRAEMAGRRPADQMDDREIVTAVEEIRGLLAARGVSLDLRDGTPARAAYEYLLKTLTEEDFEHTGPGVVTHLDGCSGYCPDCFQRPWCDLGQEEQWEQDGEGASRTDPS